MELKGKKVFFLGDSITYGLGASDYGKSLVPSFAKISGAEVKNYSVCGTRIARQTVKFGCDSWNMDFLERAEGMESDADIVIVFGSTNDFGHGDAKIGDFDSKSEYTFYGAMRCLCEKLLNKYPNSEIIFITPLHRLGEDTPVKENGLPNEISLSGYVSIIKEIAGYYGLPVLDLFNISGIQPNVEIIKKLYMPDGLHPSDKCIIRIAERLYNFLKNL
ncbi:MAG: SGNH/GDSL hydrolase family protein [Clostridia bacterium]|nr:SGNH/GDSL hydrolase family protein [Clostridia bacterium]